METIVKKYQQEYYQAIAQSDAKGDSTDFIVFMLKCILQTISEQRKVTDNVGINVGVNVGINEQRVLDALRADASLSAVKIGRLLGITTRQAERLLASLREKNLIRRIGANKNGHWEIIK